MPQFLWPFNAIYCAVSVARPVNTSGLPVSRQRIADLEEQLTGVCEELRAARAHHKQQLAEMAKLREEERQKALLEREEQQEQLQQHRRDMERSHQRQREEAQEKVGRVTSP